MEISGRRRETRRPGDRRAKRNSTVEQVVLIIKKGKLDCRPERRVVGKIGVDFML
jgi:hypothetical protein